MQVPATEQQNIRFGSFKVDLASHELWNDGHRISLQEKPFQILVVLIGRHGELVAREELRQKLWPADTFVDFDHSINTAVKQLRKALEDNADRPHFIETLPRRGYRFIAQVERTVHPETAATPEQTAASENWQTRARRRWYVPLAIGAIAALVLLAGLYLAGIRDRWVHSKITEQDTILLTDFVNKTGDPVFDDALKQALAVELRQSPFLNVVSDRTISQTLRMMGRSNGPITMDVGRDLCQRTGSKGVLGGSITSLGSHYVINLNAVTCGTGDTLAEEEGEASSKEDVLKTLSQASSALRVKLGESLPSVQKFEIPIQVTTSSLEALKAYSLGLKIKYEQGDAPSVPFLKQAIELDPNFASAYAALSIACTNSGQRALALEYATKAYELRDRVSEREKQGLSATYFHARGEDEKLVETYQLLIANYPRDFVPHGNLGVVYNSLGEYDKALAEYRTAARLKPDNVINYANLGSTFVLLNRLDEAKATFDEALAHKLDAGTLRQWIYQLAFQLGDTAQMDQQVAWSIGKPGDEDAMLGNQADTEACYGRVKRAGDYSRRAVDSALRAGSKENAAWWHVSAALREAELGNSAAATQRVAKAFRLFPGRDVKVIGALALARTSDYTRAADLSRELAKEYPTNTMLKFYWLPTIHAAVAVTTGKASQALADLEPTMAYEHGLAEMGISALYPAYVRGQAYLAMHNGTGAAAEFQKLLKYRGVVQNFLTGSLVHVQLGRAYAAAGDTGKAKVAYQHFFTLWKDADPNIPIYKQAKAEYAKLQ